MAHTGQENGQPNGNSSLGNDGNGESHRTTSENPIDRGKSAEKAEKASTPPQMEPSMLNKAWRKLGITPPLLAMMLK